VAIFKPQRKLLILGGYTTAWSHCQ